MFFGFSFGIVIALYGQIEVAFTVQACRLWFLLRLGQSQRAYKNGSGNTILASRSMFFGFSFGKVLSSGECFWKFQIVDQ
jgi:hypothetical protein